MPGREEKSSKTTIISIFRLLLYDVIKTKNMKSMQMIARITETTSRNDTTRELWVIFED